MLTKTLDRLEETIDAETAALLARDLSAMDEFNRRKSQSLLEITRMIRTVTIEAVQVARFEGLRAKLEVNQNILDRYMRAVQEISTIVSTAIEGANSDGTYSANMAGRRLATVASPSAGL
ncbi:hypothetical protein [Microvirga massiliensis]|uniref:hypothetical protein n=1 Tax=Microvirga massiliensis TaxID=1033741 RepID=UPI00062BE850|nr:hypothetical protein [Microvirga massiliensis]